MKHPLETLTTAAGILLMAFLSCLLLPAPALGLALAIGIILSRTLLRHRRTRWQQSPFLLTASTPVKEDRDEDDEKKE